MINGQKLAEPDRRYGFDLCESVDRTFIVFDDSITSAKSRAAIMPLSRSITELCLGASFFLPGSKHLETKLCSKPTDARTADRIGDAAEIDRVPQIGFGAANLIVSNTLKRSEIDFETHSFVDARVLNETQIEPAFPLL